MQKNVLLPVRIATSQSLASSFNSTPTQIKYLDNICYQVNVTTTNSVGVFNVQISLDYIAANDVAGPANAGTWSTLPLSGTASAQSANDVITFDLNSVPATAIRLAYTSSTAGTGTCNITVAAKANS